MVSRRVVVTLTADGPLPSSCKLLPQSQARVTVM
jgi:hypothetical protein